MKAEGIAGCVHRVLKGYVNAYVIEADEGLILVDTGMPKTAERIAESIRDLLAGGLRVISTPGHTAGHRTRSGAAPPRSSGRTSPGSPSRSERGCSATIAIGSVGMWSASARGTDPPDRGPRRLRRRRA